jgi:hypothetical protein
MTKNKTDLANLLLREAISPHRSQVQRDSNYALGIITLMQEAMATVLKQHGIPAVQVDAIKDEVVKEYIKLAQGKMTEQIILERPLAGQIIPVSKLGNSDNVTEICRAGDNFILQIQGDLLAVKPISTDSGYDLEVLSSFADKQLGLEKIDKATGDEYRIIEGVPEVEPIDLSTIDFNQDKQTLLRWGSTLNVWEWPEDMCPKPERYDELPTHLRPGHPQRRYTKHELINPIVFVLHTMTTERERLHYHHINNLGKTDEQFEEWWNDAT